MANPIHKTKRGYYVASFASGGEFLFDEIDLPLIRAHTWHLGKRGYPATHIGGRTVVLHRLLFPDAQEYEIDHINGDKLDNRRRNLRLCTHQQNAFNQKRRRTNTSGYIGVSYARGRGCFEAYIHMGMNIFCRLWMIILYGVNLCIEKVIKNILLLALTRFIYLIIAM